MAEEVEVKREQEGVGVEVGVEVGMELCSKTPST